MKKRKYLFAILLLLIFFTSGLFVEKHKLINKLVLSYFYPTQYKKKMPDFYYPAVDQDLTPLFNKNNNIFPYRFIVYGDSIEPASDEIDMVVDKIIEENPSFILHVGDMVRLGDTHNWKIFDIFTGKILEKQIPFYPSLGNHEYHTRRSLYPPDPNKQLQHYFKRFPHLGKRRWYSFTYNNSIFIILDTNTVHSPGSKQYNWLKETLKENTNRTFAFVFFHYPVYSKGPYAIMEAEKRLSALFEGAKKEGMTMPDIVFSGHSHNYERYRENAVNYVVTGGGGSPAMMVQRDENDFYNRWGDTYHYCDITVFKNNLTFRMMRLDEDTGIWIESDRFTISKPSGRDLTPK